MKSVDPSLTTNGEGMLRIKNDTEVRKRGKWLRLDTLLIHAVNDDHYD